MSDVEAATLRGDGDALPFEEAALRREWQLSVQRASELELRSRTLEARLADAQSERDQLLASQIRLTSSPPGRVAAAWISFTLKHPAAARLIGRPLVAAWLVLTLRWPRFLRPNPLFDERWYAKTYQDVPTGRHRAYWHFIRRGIRERRDPNEFFDTGWYLEKYADITDAAMDPLDHYLRKGWIEGRDPSPRFSSYDYLLTHRELIGTGTNPLLHFLRVSKAKSPASRVQSRAKNVEREQITPSSNMHQVGGNGRNGHVSLVQSSLVDSQDPTAGTALSEDGDVVAFERPAVDKRPDFVHATVDLPKDGSYEASSTMAVFGWACSRAGIASIDVYLDEQPRARASVGIARPDVANAFPDIQGAVKSGYALDLDINDLTSGEHALTVAVHDLDGYTRVITRGFHRLDSNALDHQSHIPAAGAGSKVL